SRCIMYISCLTSCATPVLPSWMARLTVGRSAGCTDTTTDRPAKHELYRGSRRPRNPPERWRRRYAHRRADFPDGGDLRHLLLPLPAPAAEAAQGARGTVAGVEEGGQ